MAIGHRRQANSIASWLSTATRGLTKNSAKRVREEVEAHFDSAREDAAAQGAGGGDAHLVALASLGDPRAANRANKSVHVTKSEAKVMCEERYVENAICSRPYLIAVPVLILCAGIAAFAITPSMLGLTLIVGGAGICFVFGVPFIFPINTPARGRVYRGVRWAWLIAVMWLAFGPGDAKGSWAQFAVLGGSMLWIVAWAEWKRASVRRKTPVADWPRGMYL